MAAALGQREPQEEPAKGKGGEKRTRRIEDFLEEVSMGPAKADNWRLWQGLGVGARRDLEKSAEAGKSMSKAGMGTLGQAKMTATWIQWHGLGSYSTVGSQGHLSGWPLILGQREETGGFPLLETRAFWLKQTETPACPSIGSKGEKNVGRI